jgi:hypothetical protein
MSFDIKKLIDNLDLADKHFDGAMAELVPLERMSVADSCVMGHIYAVLAGIRTTREFIKQCGAYKAPAEGDQEVVSKHSLTYVFHISPGFGRGFYFGIRKEIHEH